jgi:hypothetical protein
MKVNEDSAARRVEIESYQAGSKRLRVTDSEEEAASSKKFHNDEHFVVQPSMKASDNVEGRQKNASKLDRSPAS